MAEVTNIAAYQFARLTDLKPLRERLTALCHTLQLKGKILLSAEGVNLFVAGQAEACEALLTELRSLPALAALRANVSRSWRQPFSRMLVKIKKEIITFGVEGIDPITFAAPRLAPAQLKQWLDDGKPVTLLDTRNDYEVKLGTFDGAHAIGITHFREFPEATKTLPEEWKRQPIVTFCTGGIRCEKAGSYLIRQGFREVYQLDGGILKYFEDCGASHYHGECYVFDERVGLDPSLGESSTTSCAMCGHPVSLEEQADPRFIERLSCPHCHIPTDARREQLRQEHQAKLDALVSPLPGSTPATNYRPLRVGAIHDGLTVLDFLCAVLPHTPRSTWAEVCQAGHIVDAGHHDVSAALIVRLGERYFRMEPAQIEPDINAAIRILHEDEAIIVIDKPAPLPMHPSGRFNRNTLKAILTLVYAPQKPRPAHRLDANTTGVVVFCRTSTFAHRLQSQFELGEVSKLYLARVQGHPREDEFECHASLTDSAEVAGSRSTTSTGGLAAHTSFRVLQRFADGTALLEVTPHTGRTNQIRVHLAHLGYPIVGDPTYGLGHERGDTQTLSPTDPPMGLHALTVKFRHPVDGKPVEFTAPAPNWLVATRGA